MHIVYIISEFARIYLDYIYIKTLGMNKVFVKCCRNNTPEFLNALAALLPFALLLAAIPPNLIAISRRKRNVENEYVLGIPNKIKSIYKRIN